MVGNLGMTVLGTLVNGMERTIFVQVTRSKILDYWERKHVVYVEEALEIQRQVQAQQLCPHNQVQVQLQDQLQVQLISNGRL